MSTHIRNMNKSDLSRVGEILFEAFNKGASKRGYAPRVPSVQEGTAWAWALLRHTPSEPLVAEVDARTVGICCLNPRGDHGGFGPVAVDPSYEGYGIGRQLMDALLKESGRFTECENLPRGIQSCFFLHCTTHSASYLWQSYWIYIWIRVSKRRWILAVMSVRYLRKISMQ